MTAQSIIDRLNASQRTVCTAESLTAGLVSAALCNVPGASGCVLGGVAAYQDQVKERLLSVSPQTIASRTAVSAACAREMAEGAREKFDADFALSTTGYAGPGGEEVGLVFVGLATRMGTAVRRLRLTGSRQGIRRMTAQLALYFLQKEIENHGEGKEHQEGR